MKLLHSEDIAVSQEQAFAGFSDLDGLMAALAPRGVDLIRDDAPAAPQPGSIWRTTVSFHGLEREVEISLDGLTPPAGYSLSGKSPELAVTLEVGFAALAADQTRMTLDVTVRPRGLSGHVLMPPLHMLRPKLEHRLATHLEARAREIESQA